MTISVLRAGRLAFGAMVAATLWGGMQAALADDAWRTKAIAKLSVLGVGMRSHTGVATRMFGALADRNINITLINTSEVRINVATDLALGRKGLSCLRQVFSLPDEP